MNGGGRRREPPAAVGAPRRNRLSRRRSQTGPAEVLESVRNQTEPEFKTPTRIPRTKPSSVPGPDSPYHDPDLQQEIVWDAASPSPPRRSGTVGKKAAAGGAVNISEIVSRIAPKHGRPRVSEPALQQLQQWIGDSAAISCTPDPQCPPAKRRPPRATGVENLQRLARQLDQNLFQNQNLEEFLTGEGQSPGSFGPEPRSDPDFLQDDLDFLFDGPTQTPSRTLSRGPTQNRPGSGSVDGSGPATSGTRSGPGLVQNQLEDDWENDDLLNDALVLEPDRFLVPKLCSTQNPAGSGQGWVAPLVGTRTEKENLDPAWNPGWSSGSGKSVQIRPEQNRFSSTSRAPEPGQMCSLEPEPQWFWSDPTNRAGPDGLDALGDLDSVFRSEPVWDGLADDLLCEMCEDLENRIQIQRDRSGSDQSAALQPTHKTSGNRIRPDPPGPVSCSMAAAPLNQPIGFQLPPPAVVFRNRTGSEPSVVPRPKDTQYFTFRRPGDGVTMTTEKGKCSAAEIELKKQQVLERRRQQLARTGTS